VSRKSGVPGPGRVLRSNAHSAQHSKQIAAARSTDSHNRAMIAYANRDMPNRRLRAGVTTNGSAKQTPRIK
jgi:hypothetical protein